MKELIKEQANFRYDYIIIKKEKWNKILEKKIKKYGEFFKKFEKKKSDKERVKLLKRRVDELNLKIIIDNDLVTLEINENEEFVEKYYKIYKYNNNFTGYGDELLKIFIELSGIKAEYI